MTTTTTTTQKQQHIEELTNQIKQQKENQIKLKKFLFDLENLSSLLEKQNFGEIRSSQYCSTQDDIDRSVDSIYLNCIKI